MSGPTINEFVFNHIGTDTAEFIEVFLPPGLPFEGTLSLLVVEGDGADAGVVDRVFAVGPFNAQGIWATGFLNNMLENGTQSLLLVDANTATLGQDLDTNNDGALDVIPGSVLNSVAVSDGGASDRTYADVILNSTNIGDGFTPGGASRVPDGFIAGDGTEWRLNDFDGAGLPGFTGSVTGAEVANTPGASNGAALVLPPQVVVSLPIANGVTEGGAGNSFSATLSSQPTADVVLSVTPDAQLSTSVTQLVFTSANWNVAQSVTVNAVDDAVVEGTHAGTVVFGPATSTDANYNGQDPADPQFTITDNDVATALTEISAIQGAGHRSALEGQVVITTGIVTARSNNGFWMQDPTPDADIATSEGLFVFTGSAPAVAVGDAVQVAGTVTEFTRNTADPGHLSITQLTAPTVTVQSSGNALPAAVVIGTDRTPPTEITDLDAFTEFNAVRDGVDFWESLEGMRLELPNAMAVSPSFNSTSVTNRAETFAVANQGLGATGLNADGGLTLSETDANPERVAVQANQQVLPGADFVTRPGDLLGDVVGVLDYDNRGNFEIILTQAITVVDGGLTKEAATALAGDATTLSVGTYNVENLAGTTSNAKFTALGIDIADLLGAPDIIALQEIQDNNGATNNGVVDASETYGKLIAAITAAGGPTYKFLNIDPDNNTSGGAPGGNIRVGFLYNDDRVDVVDGSLRQVDPTNAAAWAASRIPLAADFVFNGEVITVVNNHWASKGGSSPQFGTIQPLQNGSEDQRVLQAASVKGFVDDLLAEDANANVIVMGDLNEFAWEDSLDIVTGRAAGEQVLFDLFELSEPDATERYEYVFDGNHQILDHLLASDALVAGGFAFDSLQVNSQFPSAQRNSDHDPAVATFTLPVPEAFPAGVSSGDVDQDSAVLWALVSVAGPASFELTGADGTTVVIVLDVTATNVPLKIEVNGLTAGTEYNFTVTDSLGRSETGSFSTAADVGEYQGFRFGVSGDWRGELLPYPAISNADEAGLDLFVKLGDTIYADFPSPAVPADQATTLAEYRAKHAEVYSDAFWQDLQAVTPILATIDDHEVINDFSGGQNAAEDPRVGATTGLVNDSPLYETGLQAFGEYNAIEDRNTGATGDPRTDNEIDLYRYNTYGSDAAVYVLDARSFRDAPLADWNGTPADAVRFLTESATLDRTMLGNHQQLRLFADLLDADAKGITWKFVHVPEPIQNFGPLGAADRFEGYARERAEILAFIDAADIENVVFVAADVHGTVVNNLTYQLSPGGPQLALNSFEITTGSVAFDPPFAPAAINFAAAAGLLSPEQLAFYNSLPVAPDADSIPNDKDDFFKLIINQQTAPLGYDPVGLNANLAQANGRLDATLLQGDYVAAHTFGWTQFDIDAATQDLTVTTYGILPPSALATAVDGGPVPTVVSEFVVQAARAVEFTLWRDAANPGRNPPPADPAALLRQVATELHYTDQTAVGVQLASSLTDTATAADTDRFLSTAGDVAISRIDFAGAPSLGTAGAAAVATLDWLDTDSALLRLDAAWNAVKTVQVQDFTGASLRLENWVDVLVQLEDATRDLTIIADGMKRGVIETGSGDDLVNTLMDANNLSFDNTVRVNLGAGDDIFLIDAASRDFVRSKGWVLSGVRTEVTGGDGDDNLVGSASTDTAVFLGDRADYTVEVLGGVTQVTALAGDEGVDLIQNFEFLRFADATLALSGGVWA